ncbi:MAG: mannuronan 5-epimerase [Frankiales bacterium]|nr:mannuronan 5-epimerase [Frankiales bacterium]
MRRGRIGIGPVILVTIVALTLGVMGTWVFGRTYSGLELQKAPFGRLSYVPSYDPIQDVTLGLPMDSGSNKVQLPDKHIRALLVYPTSIILATGGKNSKVISTATPVTTLAELVSLVDDPSWIKQTGSVITMYAAAVFEKGMHISVTAPTTTEVTMQADPGVFLAVNTRSRLDIDGVYIHASNQDTPNAGSRVAVRADLGRPFVLANDNSTMTVANSTFRYLGRDWNSSYGLAWEKGSSGSVSNSLFEHNFIGIYTDHTDGLKIEDSQFYFNSLYGIDPHSFSTNLLIERNISNYNGRHGIIGSDHVTNTIVRNNTTIGNGLNGIMMDEFSDGNHIEQNTVTGNKGDGIVMASSSKNLITDNVVEHNRVGLHVRGESSGNSFADNTVAHNQMAAQGVSLHGNNGYGNGGDWSAARIVAVWVITLLIAVLLVLATMANSLRRIRRSRMAWEHNLALQGRLDRELVDL